MVLCKYGIRTGFDGYEQRSSQSCSILVLLYEETCSIVILKDIKEVTELKASLALSLFD